MKRTDTHKTGSYEANYNAGWVTTDESTAELTGTKVEVEVIVWALEHLVLEQKRLRMLGVAFSNPYQPQSGIYHSAQYASAEVVLHDIQEPNQTD